jgi:branched-chain amino acid transport system substrate-binding protein
MISHRLLLASAAALSALAALAAPASPSLAQGAPIKIGEINSYTGLPAFTVPYRNGWTLALDEINAKGGVGGRKLEFVSRDDGGKPEDAVRIAGELVTNEKVNLLAGTFFSHIGLAVSDYAKAQKVLFVAAEPLADAITLDKGHRYTFRLRPSTYMQVAMLVEAAAAVPAKKWATVAPNYEYGQSAVKVFKELLKARKPDVEFVGEQWPAQGKLEAGPTVQALEALKPDAIFNVTFGADLSKFVREGTTRGLWEKRHVVSLLTGEPEYLDPLKGDAPVGWIVTGYPQEQIDTPAHKAFRDAYQKKFNDYPRLGSVVGYALVHSIAAAITKAGGTDTEKLIAAMEGMEFETPKGTMTFRKEDHQAMQAMYHFRVKKDWANDFDMLDLVREIPAKDIHVPIRNKR